MNNSILTIEECRNHAINFLKKGNRNVFLINEYLENDNSNTVNFQQYSLCRNAIFDSIYKESLYYHDANRSGNWFHRIEDQVYKLIRSEENYKTDILYVHMILGGIVSELINYLTENFPIDAATAGGISYFLIYTITKIGINAWCQKYEEERNIRNGEE